MMRKTNAGCSVSMMRSTIIKTTKDKEYQPTMTPRKHIAQGNTFEENVREERRKAWKEVEENESGKMKPREKRETREDERR
jgi:hypothetical protein